MKSITYIKRNLTNLNRSILSQLLQSEEVELTDELWNYLTETPWNTNWRLLEKFGIDIREESGSNAEVWLIGDTSHLGEFVLSNIDSVDHITELYNNSSNYQIFLNDVELSYLTTLQDMVMWTNSDVDKDITKAVVIADYGDPSLLATASWFDDPAPTSVKVSVKAK